jgi:FkbM family methyltransferase
MTAITAIKNLVLGNKRFQRLFETLYKVSIKGMNYDRGHVPGLSGEAYVLKTLRRHFGYKEMTVFDVGGNNGQYAKLALKTLGEDTVLYSFEPSAKTFERLAEVKAKNFHAINKGLSATENKEMILYSNEPGSEWASLYQAKHEHYHVTLDQAEKIALTTLDGFCKNNEVGHIDFLKIDVEGHEIEVLKGATAMLRGKNIDFIQFEFGLASIAAKIFLKDFFTHLPGYRIYRILQNGLYEIHYNERYELFLTTNYLAIRNDLNPA